MSIFVNLDNDDAELFLMLLRKLHPALPELTEDMLCRLREQGPIIGQVILNPAGTHYSQTPFTPLDRLLGLVIALNDGDPKDLHLQEQARHLVERIRDTATEILAPLGPGEVTGEVPAR